MNGFEYVLTLLGLLLGLALTEALSGLARALKARRRVRIGWSTALLGALIACDLITFWAYGWSMRSEIEPTWPTLFAGFVLTGIYYLAASLIFPDDPYEDHEAHFEANHRMVLAGFVLCNAGLIGWVVSIVGIEPFANLRTLIVTWSLFPVTILAIVTRQRRVVIACILWLLALYPLSLVW